MDTSLNNIFKLRATGSLCWATFLDFCFALATRCPGTSLQRMGRGGGSHFCSVKPTLLLQRKKNLSKAVIAAILFFLLGRPSLFFDCWRVLKRFCHPPVVIVVFHLLLPGLKSIFLWLPFSERHGVTTIIGECHVCSFPIVGKPAEGCEK